MSGRRQTPRRLIRGLTANDTTTPSGPRTTRAVASAGKSSALRSSTRKSSGRKKTSATPTSAKRTTRVRDDPAKLTPRTMIRGLTTNVKSTGKKVPKSVTKVAPASKQVKETPRTLLRNVLANATPLATGPSASPMGGELTPTSMPGSLNTSFDTSLNVSHSLATPAAGVSSTSLVVKATEWDQTQDDLLAKLCSLYGTKDWIKISNAFNKVQKVSRTSSDVNDRWHSHLKDLTNKKTSTRSKNKSAATLDCPIPPSLANFFFASFAKTTVAADAKVAVCEALNQYFPLMVADLKAYAEHAGRQTIEMTDVELLMERQRITQGKDTPSAMDLARKHLPMETLESLLSVALAGNDVLPPMKKRRQPSRRSKKTEAT